MGYITDGEPGSGWITKRREGGGCVTKADGEGGCWVTKTQNERWMGFKKRTERCQMSSPPPSEKTWGATITYEGYIGDKPYGSVGGK